MEHEIRQCSQDDCQKIKDIAHDFPNVDVVERVESEAKALVDNLQNAIRKTATALLKKKRLTFEDVQNVYSASRSQLKRKG
jgi:hypothetical protein